ncbi:UNVERIFIED_CONTAM: hypothetical protein GTU68_057462 [Idotea baltica]|nr:hypothetical protein [Idotea baltica]
MATIALEGIRFFAYHGLYPEEQANGNHFQVDVYLNTGSRKLPENDEIEGTVDYAKVFAVIKEVMENRANLLETLVGRIGRKLIASVEGFDSVKVRVTKENPPLDLEMPGGTSYVESEFRPS